MKLGGKANEGKKLTIEIEGEKWLRIPIRTHLITSEDEMVDLVNQYAKPHLENSDLLFISERIVAITQGRAFHISTIKPSWLAKFLVKFVHKSDYGIGLGSPWTMELAIKEAGFFRIFLGCLAAIVTKPFKIKGVFYKVVGKNINAIDGPCDYTLPPYDHYAKLGPKDPEKVANELSKILGAEVVIIDANDLGVCILGKSSSQLADTFCQKVFKDNPLGQSTEQTPFCLVRKG